MADKSTWHERMIAAEAEARDAFNIIDELGFRLRESRVSEGSNARYDGWEQTYRRRWVTLNVRYYEMELVVRITRHQVQTSYLFLDHRLYNNASGFQGCMFPPEKLPDVLRRIAVDLRTNYRDILLGNRSAWKQVKELESERRNAERESAAEVTFRYQHGLAIQSAMQAFQDKDYRQVCLLLDPIEDKLNELQRKKLNYARKKA